jgi:amino acid transporter
LLGIFSEKFGKMKKINSKAGFFGVIFWILGMVFYFVLAQVGSPDALILIAVSVFAPLFSFINLIAILLKKKHTWVDPEYKTKGLRYLMIFMAVLVVYVIGLIIA